MDLAFFSNQAVHFRSDANRDIFLIFQRSVGEVNCLNREKMRSKPLEVEVGCSASVGMPPPFKDQSAEWWGREVKRSDRSIHHKVVKD